VVPLWCVWCESKQDQNFLPPCILSLVVFIIALAISAPATSQPRTAPCRSSGF
jgi:hypothetical protein